MSHFSLFTIRLKWASIGKRLTRWDSQRAFQSSAQAHLHMACFSLALSILGLACWLWIRKCMWIFTCTSFENESCDFEKIILWFWKDHTVCGWGMTCKYRCQKNASALKVNYVTNDGIARFEKSHTHSRPKRWRREHQSTNYRLHFFVWLKRWITNRDFFFPFMSNIPSVSISESDG